MERAQYDLVQVLNGLVETTIDSAQGYEQAAGLARNPRFKSLFQDRAQARRRLAGELQDQVRACGGRPLAGGSIIGPAHRAFLAMRGRVSGQTDRPVIEEVERGEAFMRDQFDRAAQDGVLPDEARKLVERARDHVRADHDEINELKIQFH